MAEVGRGDGYANARILPKLERSNLSEMTVSVGNAVMGVTLMYLMTPLAGYAAWVPAVHMMGKAFAVGGMGYCVYRAFRKGDPTSDKISGVLRNLKIEIACAGKEPMRPQLMRKDDNVYVYRVPAGLCAKHFEAVRPAIEVQLDAETEIWEQGGLVHIRVLDQPIPGEGKVFDLVDLGTVHPGEGYSSEASLPGNVEGGKGICGPVDPTTPTGGGVHEVGQKQLDTDDTKPVGVGPHRPNIRYRFQEVGL